ncbi:MAG: hypothetical protein WCK35_07495, partial [Chloroflexota bacterium]
TTANSIVAVGWAQALIALFVGILNLYVATRLLKIASVTLLDALKPAVLAGIIMSAVILIFLSIAKSMITWVQLGLGTILGVLSYIAAIWIFQRDVIDTASIQIRSALTRIK